MGQAYQIAHGVLGDNDDGDDTPCYLHVSQIITLLQVQ